MGCLLAGSTGGSLAGSTGSSLVDCMGSLLVGCSISGCLVGSMVRVIVCFVD